MTTETELQQPAAAADTAAPVESAATETPSMEDTIRSAWRASQAKPEGADAETAADIEEPVADKAPRTNSAGRMINEKGQFLKADGTIVATEEEADLAEADLTKAEKPVEQKPAGQYAEPPKSWKKEEAVDWAKLPESSRAAIYRREEDFHKGIQQYSQMAGVGNTLHKAIEPYAQMIIDSKVTAPALIGDLLRMQKVATTGTPEERTALVLDIIRSTGIPIETLTQAAQQQPAVDPNIAALIQKVQQLEGTLNGQTKEREQADVDKLNTEIESFRTDGKHEHFSAVALDMSALIERGRAKDLQDAYDKAVWANPETREKLLQKHEQERTRKQADEAAAARKASVANVARRGTPPAVQKPGTMEDTIRAELRRLNGAG